MKNKKDNLSEYSHSFLEADVLLFSCHHSTFSDLMNAHLMISCISLLFFVFTGANTHDAKSLCVSQADVRAHGVPVYLSDESNPGLSFELCAQQCLTQHHP